MNGLVTVREGTHRCPKRQPVGGWNARRWSGDDHQRARRCSDLAWLVRHEFALRHVQRVEYPDGAVCQRRARPHDIGWSLGAIYVYSGCGEHMTSRFQHKRIRRASQVEPPVFPLPGIGRVWGRPVEANSCQGGLLLLGKVDRFHGIFRSGGKEPQVIRVPAGCEHYRVADLEIHQIEVIQRTQQPPDSDAERLPCSIGIGQRTPWRVGRSRLLRSP